MILKIATQRQMDPIGTFHKHPKNIFCTTNRVEAGLHLRTASYSVTVGVQLSTQAAGET